MFATHILTNIASVESLEDRFLQATKQYGKFKKSLRTGKIMFPWDKWMMFHGHMGFDDLDISIEAICNRWKKLLVLPHILALDEQTPPYHPSSSAKIKNKAFGWDIPLLHVESKPHPHCFWLSTLSTKLLSSNSPFILYVVPFYRQPQLSPDQVCGRVMKFLEDEDTKLIIMDRLFDSDGVRKVFDDHKHFYLISAKSSLHGGIDKVLGESLPVKEWRVVHDDKDLLYSVENIQKKTGDVETVFCVSNGFTFEKNGKTD